MTTTYDEGIEQARGAGMMNHILPICSPEYFHWNIGHLKTGRPFFALHRHLPIILNGGARIGW